MNTHDNNSFISLSKLKMYSIAACAFIACNDIEAQTSFPINTSVEGTDLFDVEFTVDPQISYTDIPDVVVQGWSYFGIDFNGDGLIDIGFGATSSLLSGGGSTTYCPTTTGWRERAFFVAGSGVDSASIMLSSAYKISAPQLYSQIGTMGNWGGPRNIARWSYEFICQSIYTVLTPLYNPIAPSETAFLGFRFSIGGNTHYGWVRVGNLSGGVLLTLFDFAYEQQPNTPILAGDLRPVLQVPDVAPITAVNSCGETVNYTVVAEDLILGGAVNLEQLEGLPSGSAFPIGTTTNTFRATNIRGFVVEKSFDVTVLASALFAPQNFTAVAGSSLVDLQWDPIPESIGCRVQGGPLGTGFPGSLTMIGPNVKDVSIPAASLAPGLYEARVVCACKAGDGSILLTSPSTPASFAIPSARAGVSEGEPVALNVSPNPTSGTISLNFEGTQSEVTLTVHDLIGREMIRREIALELGANNLQLELDALPAGSYLLRIDDGTVPRSVQFEKVD